MVDAVSGLDDSDAHRASLHDRSVDRGAGDNVIRLLVDDKPAILVADGHTIGAFEPGKYVEVRQKSRRRCTWSRRSDSTCATGCGGVSERVMPKAQLVELYAHGLGVIDEARLEFGAGFNVMTGETGAGKTLLLGALALALGDDSGVRRATRSPTDTRAVALFLRGDDEEFVLTRDVTATRVDFEARSTALRPAPKPASAGRGARGDSRPARLAGAASKGRDPATRRSSRARRRGANSTMFVVRCARRSTTE